MTVPHPRVPHPLEGFNDRVGDRIGGWFGSMRTLWVLMVWMFGWMILADLGVWLFAKDAYPHPFLLFLSNLVQLFALPVLGSIQNRADIKRTAKADADHQALTYLATRTDAIATHLGVPED